MKKNLEFKSQLETEQFAEMLSLWAKPGLVIELSGDLGSGKSTFARAFIKSLAKADDNFDIPSPSFSLVQLYDTTRVAVAHVDLYRLSNATEVAELGLTELSESHIILVEWPDRMARKLSNHTLSLNFSGRGDKRWVEVSAQGSWIEALKRNAEIENFLSQTSWSKAKRLFLEGDASSRRYETLNGDHGCVILMDMPQRPDGPPVIHGKPYSAVAHLAEGLSSVVTVNLQLTSFDYSAPKIEAHSSEHGLAIIENLGGLVYGRMMLDGADMREPMIAAVELLADMQSKSWPTTINSYDIEALLIEADLLVSWFWPFIHRGTPAQSLHDSFADVWRKILPFTISETPYWVMRDFHSPNLIWLPDRDNIKRVGLIDTQDAVLGHPAYDLASLLQDARVDIDFSWADELFHHYETLRHKQGSFNAEKFSTAYCILGAQRATKILGIFARLAKRDGKPGYLKHMPRVSRYLVRNLSHPELVELKNWYETNMPEALEVGIL
jgi:N-acetylmuramate 1-kinase